MAYGDKALLLRRCKATRRDGMPCKAYAKWGDSVCSVHRTSRKKMTNPHPLRKCDCAAYPFPHRPAGGFCRWPEKPLLKTEKVKDIFGVSRNGVEICLKRKSRAALSILNALAESSIAF